MRTALHYTLLVYPFRHALSAGEERLRRASARWKPWWSRLDENGLERALDDTYFFVPYVCKLLFPEAAYLRRGREGRGPDEECAAARALAEDRADVLAAKLRGHELLRLTYDPVLLEEFRHLRLEFGEGSGKAEAGTANAGANVRLDWIDVALFPQRVGFLILRARADGHDPTVNELNDLLHYLRPVHPPRVGWRLPVWAPAHAGQRLPFRSQEGLVNFLLRDLVEDGRSYTKQEEGQVYGQNFRQYTYACLADPADARPLSGDRQDASASPPPRSVFGSPAERALYELATCTLTSQPDYAPHPEGLRPTVGDGRIALWANWEGMALHDNVVFLGTEPTKFVRGDFAHNVGNDYFNLYLLTLYQKVLLSRFSGELMRDGDDLYGNLRDARKLMDRFVRFRNHYWLPGVTLKPQGAAIYQKFRDGLGVEALFRSVSDEVNQLHEYYEGKAQRHLSTLVNFIAFVAVPAGVLSQIFGSVLIKDLEDTNKKMGSFLGFIPRFWKDLSYNSAAWKHLLIAGALTAALSWVVYWMWKVWTQKDDWFDREEGGGG